jgi:hypothetical protein
VLRVGRRTGGLLCHADVAVNTTAQIAEVISVLRISFPHGFNATTGVIEGARL